MAWSLPFHQAIISTVHSVPRESHYEVKFSTSYLRAESYQG